MVKLVFLPHCLNQEQKEEIKHSAESLGYEVQVVGGGSAVKKKLQKYSNIDKVIGIACQDELKLAKEYTKPFNDKIIISIPLITEGCKNTKINLEEILSVL